MTAHYDVLLKNGHIIDPQNSLDGIADLAVKNGKIAAVGADLAGTAERLVDVAGLYITPGLIDIHLHAYGGFDAWLHPDAHNLPHGVTTCVDTGGAGYKDMGHFKETIIDKSITRVLAFVNIVGAGMVGPPEQDTTDMDPVLCAAAVERYAEHVVGVKSAHFGGPGWESTGGAIEAARRAGTIVMVDFSPKPSRSYEELCERYSPGDIHTHCYSTRTPMLDGNDRIFDFVWRARDKGVVFDLGHGNASFRFHIAVPALEQGFPPDTISTDLHGRSRMLPNATMNITMSKMLALGMPLQEVIYRSTQRPAAVIGRPALGHLSVGAEADVAVLAVHQGRFGFVDATRSTLHGRQKIEGRMTLRTGEIVWDQDGLSMPSWEEGAR
ncbi:MAG: amidohydrolase/deacetylase family metallohydrolase [Candidatus Latescibacteria bacterium]|nr:amidohydrolase/deacetylase family metallohydrolase [Candidatus Latescibacterota bacterium]